MTDAGLFGFTGEQLHPVAERALGTPVRDLRVSARMIAAEPGSDEHGGCGEKRVATFVGIDADGRERSEWVFVKLADPGCEESLHFEEMSRHAVPVARFYGALIHDDGREAVFTELLDPVLTWDDWNDDETHVEFVEAIARLNAIRPSPSYIRALTRDHVRRDMSAGVSSLSEVWERALVGRFGTEISVEIAGHPGGPEDLRQFLHATLARYDLLPKGLCHREAEGYHAGRRRTTGKLVFFDVETMGIEPRFYDVAAWYSEPPPGMPRREFAARYLDHYVRAGGARVAFDVFDAETTVIQICQNVRWLWQMFSWNQESACEESAHWTAEALRGLRTWRLRSRSVQD
jgi:hypothetical protein